MRDLGETFTSLGRSFVQMRDSQHDGQRPHAAAPGDGGLGAARRTAAGGHSLDYSAPMTMTSPGAPYTNAWTIDPGRGATPDRGTMNMTGEQPHILKDNVEDAKEAIYLWSVCPTAVAQLAFGKVEVLQSVCPKYAK